MPENNRQLSFNLSHGLNLIDSPEAIADGALVDSLNFEASSRPGSLVRRPGFSTVWEVAPSAAGGIYGLYKAYQQDEDHCWLAVRSNELWMNNKTFTAPAFLSTLAVSNAYMALATFDDTAYMVNGTDKLKLIQCSTLRVMGNRPPSTFSYSKIAGKIPVGMYKYRGRYAYEQNFGYSNPGNSTLVNITGAPNNVSCFGLGLPTPWPGVSSVSIERSTQVTASTMTPRNYFQVGVFPLGGSIVDSLSDYALQGNISPSIEIVNDLPPNLKYLQTYFYRMFGAGDSSKPSRLYWSRFQRPDCWNKAGTLGTFYTNTEPGFTDDVYRDDGAPITGILALERELLVWSETKLYTLSGRSPARWTLEKIADTGCIAPRSIVSVDEGVFWLGKGHVYWYAGGTSRIVSWNIDAIIRNALGDSTFAEACAGYDRKENWYWLSLPVPTVQQVIFPSGGAGVGSTGHIAPPQSPGQRKVSIVGTLAVLQ